MGLYKLYRVEIIKDILMVFFITQYPARNLVDAENQFEPHMIPGCEYIIILSK